MQMGNDPQQLREEKLSSLFWRYAVPAIVSTTAMSLYNIIDRVFIGQGVGAMAISGLALTFPLMNLGVALGTLVGVGASARVSIRMGEKRRDDAICTLGNAFVLNVIIGLLYAIGGLVYLDPVLYLFGASGNTIPYAREFMQIILMGNVITHLFFGLNSIMRASGYPSKAMISIIMTITINALLAPLFIFLLHWGIRGAALATVISQAAGLVWVLAHFSSRRPYVHFTPEGFRLSWRIIIDIFAIGISPFFLHSCTCLVVMVMNLQLGRYGGDLAIGAFGIISSIMGLSVMVIFGFAQGMQPIVGYNYGAGLTERVVEAFKITVSWATAISITGFLASVLFPVPIAMAFTHDPQLIMFTSRGMGIFVLAFPLVGFQMVTAHFFQSIGKVKISIFLSLSRQALCLVPLILIFPRFWGLKGVWAATPASDLLSSVLTALVLWHYYRKVQTHRAQPVSLQGNCKY